MFPAESADRWSVYTIASFAGLARHRPTRSGRTISPTAGDYEIRAIVFENEGGSGGELSARFGSVAAWDSTFKLIGDTANGGLADKVRSDRHWRLGLWAFVSTNLKAPMFDAVPAEVLGVSPLLLFEPRRA
jgi:hypothetical protein